MLTRSFSRLIIPRSLPFLCAGLVSLFYVSTLTAELTSNQAPSKLAPSGTQFVLINDPWNQADELGHGFCSQNFLLGAFEWTVLDWKEKVLDRVACKIDVNNENPALQIADPHGLWNKKMERWITRKETTPGEYVYSIAHPGRDEYLPITNVNLFDTFRACNIMQRLKKYGPSLGLKESESFDEVTERGGAYTITTNSAGKQEAYRTAGGCFYISNQDEWVKAGYYTPHYHPKQREDTNALAGYYLYPTQQNISPRNKWDQCLENRANYIADYHSWLWEPIKELSKVNCCGWLDAQGEAHGTRSYYGCFDMAGNVNEWVTTREEVKGNNRIEMNNEWWISSGDENSHYDYAVRGGDYESEYYMEGMYKNGMYIDNYLTRTCRPQVFNPNTRDDKIGFRMAATEEAITSLGKGFAETGHLKGRDARTIGEQTAIDTTEFIAIGLAGGVVGRVLGLVVESSLFAKLGEGVKAEINAVEDSSLASSSSHLTKVEESSSDLTIGRGPMDHNDLIPDDSSSNSDTERLVSNPQGPPPGPPPETELASNNNNNPTRESLPSGMNNDSTSDKLLRELESAREKISAMLKRFNAK